MKLPKNDLPEDVQEELIVELECLLERSSETLSNYGVLVLKSPDGRYKFFVDDEDHNQREYLLNCHWTRELFVDLETFIGNDIEKYWEE